MHVIKRNFLMLFKMQIDDTVRNEQASKNGIGRTSEGVLPTAEPGTGRFVRLESLCGSFGFLGNLQKLNLRNSSSLSELPQTCSQT
jgi:hypothetical protein